MRLILIILLMLLPLNVSAGMMMGGGIGSVGGSCDTSAISQTSIGTNLIVSTGIAYSSTLYNSTGSTFDQCKINIQVQNVNSETGTLTVYIYDADAAGAEGPPDDLIATADATLDVSTVGITYEVVSFTFASPATVPTGGGYQVVAYFSGSGDIKINTTGFVGTTHGKYSRSSGVPGASNDKLNWTETDNNGSWYYEAFE